MSAAIIKGTEIYLNQRIEISRIFVKGFYQWLKYFSNDMETLALAFQNSFVFDKFYFAVSDNKLCGMAACTDGMSPSMKLVKKDLRKHLGIIKGSIAGIVLKHELENHPYPFIIGNSCGSIEFVAVSPDCRNEGHASMLIRHIISNTHFNEFVLEAADTNLPAVKLYKKLGFHEFKRVPHKQSKQSGINNLLYMKYIK